MWWLMLGCAAPGPLDRIGDDDVWVLPLGGPAMDEAWGVDTDGSGGAWVTTHLANPSQTDVFLYRLAADATVLEEARWDGGGSDQAFGVRRDGDTLWVGGTRFHGADPVDTEAWLHRVDAGRPRFRNEPFATWDGEDAWDEVDGIAPLSDGVVAAGWTGSSDGQDVYVARFDDEGDLVAENSWGGDGWDEGNGHIVVDDDRVYVAGRIDGDGALSGGDAFVAAFSLDDLEEDWSLTWGEDGLEDALGMTSDGETLYVVGIRSGDEGLFVLAVNPIGALNWHATWDGGADEAARAIAFDPADASVVVAANADDGVVMLRFDSHDGTLLEEERWWAGDTETAHDLVIDGDRAWVVGQTDATPGGKDDAFVLAAGMRPWTFPLMP